MRAVHKQRYRRVGGRFFKPCTTVWQGQRRGLHFTLTGQRQGAPGRQQQVQLGKLGDELCDQFAGLINGLLKVVKHEKGRPPLQALHQRCQGASLTTGQLQRQQNLVEHLGAVGARGERYKSQQIEGAFGVVCFRHRQPLGHLNGEPCFAVAARPHQGHQAVAAHRLAQGDELDLGPDHSRQVGR